MKDDVALFPSLNSNSTSEDPESKESHLDIAGTTRTISSSTDDEEVLDDVTTSIVKVPSRDFALYQTHFQRLCHLLHYSNRENNEVAGQNKILSTVSALSAIPIGLISENSPPISPNSSSSALCSCCSDDSSNRLPKKIKQEHSADLELIDINAHAKYGLVLTDDRQIIQYSNPMFSKVTGYSTNEIIGRKPDFLQGSNTDPQTVDSIRSALNNAEAVAVHMLNYKKDGSPVWIYLQISPLFNKLGEITNYVGLQVFDPLHFVDRQLSVFPWISIEEVKRQKKLGIIKSAPPRAIEDKKKDRTDKKRKVEIIDLQDIEEDHKADTAVVETPTYTFVAETLLPTGFGTFQVRAYRNSENHSEPIAIIKGNVRDVPNVPVRVHDQCYTSEVLSSLKCDCRQQLEYAMKYIEANELGVIIYLPQEGRGMGLANKIKAYSLQELGYDTVDANVVLGFEDDTREYSAVKYILEDIGVSSLHLMTNNPRKIDMLKKMDINVTGRIKVITELNLHSTNYIQAKTTRMGHMWE